MLFPDVAKASHAEWWAHCRPHSNGHQLHYDSEDEGRGVVRHPVASAVLALGHDGRWKRDGRRRARSGAIADGGDVFLVARCAIFDV